MDSVASPFAESKDFVFACNCPPARSEFLAGMQRIPFRAVVIRRRTRGPSTPQNRSANDAAPLGMTEFGECRTMTASSLNLLLPSTLPKRR